MGEKESRLCDTYFLFYYTHYTIRGGSSSDGANCGMFCVNARNSFSGATWGNGAALYYEYTLYYSWW